MKIESLDKAEEAYEKIKAYYHYYIKEAAEAAGGKKALSRRLGKDETFVSKRLSGVILLHCVGSVWRSWRIEGD